MIRAACLVLVALAGPAVACPYANEADLRAAFSGSQWQVATRSVGVIRDGVINQRPVHRDLIMTLDPANDTVNLDGDTLFLAFAPAQGDDGFTLSLGRDVVQTQLPTDTTECAGKLPLIHAIGNTVVESTPVEVRMMMRITGKNTLDGIIQTRRHQDDLIVLGILERMTALREPAS